MVPEVTANAKKARSWRQRDSGFTLSTDRSDCLIEDRHINLFNGDDSVPSDICTTINLFMPNAACATFLWCWKMTCMCCGAPSDQRCTESCLLALSRTCSVWFHRLSTFNIQGPFWCVQEKQNTQMPHRLKTSFSRVQHHADCSHPPSAFTQCDTTPCIFHKLFG